MDEGELKAISAPNLEQTTAGEFAALVITEPERYTPR
jgi:hypothetical protein